MINIGEIYCGHCNDPFEPDGIPSSDPDVPEFCSDRCEEQYQSARDGGEAYWEARYGGAPIF